MNTEVSRSNFMLPVYSDPLKKREEFSVFLRKQKKQQIIETKRKRIMQDKSKVYCINHVSESGSQHDPIFVID